MYSKMRYVIGGERICDACNVYKICLYIIYLIFYARATYVNKYFLAHACK